MLLRSKIVAFLVLVCIASQAFAEHDRSAEFPELVPPRTAQGATLETEPAADASVQPSTGELVSILKRRFPQGNSVEITQAPEWFQQMIQRMVRDNVPAKYVQDKDWGKTDKRWDGLRIERDGLRVSTHRRWKEVNHGTWQRYEISPIDPQHNLTLRIDNIRDAGGGNIAFDVRLASKFHVYARTSKWAKGVRVYSVSVDAEADVQLSIACECGMRLDPQHFPPDVLLVPKVTGADVDVNAFRLERVSKLDGPLVRQLSNGVRKLLQDKIDEKREQLPDRINRQIAKNADKMRLSLADVAAKQWRTWTAVDDPDTSSAAVAKPDS